MRSRSMFGCWGKAGDAPVPAHSPHMVCGHAPSVQRAIVSRSGLYPKCREFGWKGQLDLDLSPLAIASGTVWAVAENVLVAELDRDVLGDHGKIVGIVESV